MPDSEIVLTYMITVGTFGDPEELSDKVGRALAKACALKFSDVTVYGGAGKKYRWNPTEHHG